MKPERNSLRLYGITRSKGKMYELGVPEESHIAVPEGSEPEQLFALTVGTLGDVAAKMIEPGDAENILTTETYEELSFTASFLDAFLASRFDTELASDVTLLASASYYLGRRPGSSLLLARLLNVPNEASPVRRLLLWLLQAKWESQPDVHDPLFGDLLEQVAFHVLSHFRDGSETTELFVAMEKLRHRAYQVASAADLLFVDVAAAVVSLRLTSSTWVTLPALTGIPIDRWGPVIQREEFPKELWPSQVLLGKAGLFAGASGVIQMPTSAGKTRSVEILLRSGFLANRTKVAVVMAPFRALCHEISTSLRRAFWEDDVRVNELSDALQLDFVEQVAELLGSEIPTTRYIIVLTPEKLLYALRQVPNLVNNIGIVVYDEGHQFDSGSRGITYELLLTEIKSLLSGNAQTVLVSAVIQNAKAIAEWLIGDNAKVVSGQGLLPTARSVAFASWIERLGQLMFYESSDYSRYDYFVPRVIEQQELGKLVRERKTRHFPEKNDSSDISLYLGLRLVGHGAVAIFCGRKDTASGFLTRVVEIYTRGLGIKPPAVFSDADELRRLRNIYNAHFGETSVSSMAAGLGVFAHHGNTPHGIRLSIEYGMQTGKIKFVACTSTLAQGVNLPIRYLIVSGTYQGAEKIKVRDFQNLIGRAGRAGMHTEGLIIFADPAVYDKRVAERWRFRSAVELLNPALSEDTTSSLRSVLVPLYSTTGAQLRLNATDLCSILFRQEQDWVNWAVELVRLNPSDRFDVNTIISEFRRRRRLIFAVESYLMAHRGNESFEEFKTTVERLTASTLAFHLAKDNEELKSGLLTMFSLIADNIQAREPVMWKQANYAKTLLGIESAIEIEQWVDANRDLLLSLDSNADWLSTIWPLFIQQLDDKFFHAIQPNEVTAQIAHLWVQGRPYFELFRHVQAVGGTRPWGERSRRPIGEDEVIDFCEATLGFDCSLVVAAVTQFLFGDAITQDERASSALLFQKSLKYGLPDWVSITCYERGFSDRMLVQSLRDGVQGTGFTGTDFGRALWPHREKIEEILAEYPSYFNSVLATQR